MPSHAKPLDPQPEGKTGHFLGVVTHGAEHVGIDHPRSPHFNPSVPAVPEHIDLDARFGEREEGGPEANLHVVAEITAGEEPEHRLEVGHGHAAIDHQALDLMEHERMGGIHRVGAIDPASGDDPHRRPLRFHDPDLHGARLAPQHGILGQVKVVQGITGGVRWGDIEGIEIVVNILDLGTTRDTEAEPAEKVDQLVGGLGQGMAMAQAGDGSRKRDINRAGGHGATFQPQSGGAEGGLEGLLDAVESLAIDTLAGRIQRSQPLLAALTLPCFWPRYSIRAASSVSGFEAATSAAVPNCSRLSSSRSAISKGSLELIVAFAISGRPLPADGT